MFEGIGHDLREGSGVKVSKTILHLGWKFHSIGFLISKFEFWRRFLAGKSKFTNKKSDGMEFPFQMKIIFETSTRDPSLITEVTEMTEETIIILEMT